MKTMNRILLFAMLFVVWTLNSHAQYAGDRHQYVEYLVNVNHPNRTFQTGEEAIITIQAQKGGIPLDGVKIRYSVGDEMVLPAPNQSTMFKQGVATISMGTASAPGFRECDFEFDVFGKTYKDVVKVGFDIAAIRPFTTMPADFGKFWQQEIKKARQTDLDAHMTWMPQYSDSQVDVYLVRLTVGENGKCFYGYLSKPKSSKLSTLNTKLNKYPVMFCPPGAGPYKRSPQKDFARKGFIVLNVDIHGHNPELSKEYFDGVWNSTFAYWNRGLESRDSCYYRQVYAGCVRCVDYLCSLPEWDGKNVVCKDGSQGGALSIVTAALHEKASLVCAAYPALCDLTGFAHGRAGGWPKYFFKESPERKPTDKVLTIDDKAEIETLQYFDVVNFARILKAPGYYYFGFNDNFCSPTSIFGMLNEMKAPHTIVNTYTNGHFNYSESEALASEWVVQQITTSNKKLIK
ncbi:MAG: acetylxylan esterase [Bacteroidaceae bacterium]|nr:acetylxylan esterase [Bacteroidaceae bacterium]